MANDRRSKMARNEHTSKSVASKASKLLSNSSTPKSVKSVAASALTQAPNKGGKRKIVICAVRPDLEIGPNAR